MVDDEINDRLSRRFDTGDDEAGDDQPADDDDENETPAATTTSDESAAVDGDAESGDSSQPAMTSQQSQSAQTSEPDVPAQQAQNAQKAQNIKKEWNVRSVYLDDALDDELTTAFKRLDFELSQSDADIDLQKTRHFYPLVVRLGLERLESMDITELTDALEGTDSV